MLVLRSSPASPFGRKVKIAAAVLGLRERIEIVLTDTNEEIASRIGTVRDVVSRTLIGNRRYTVSRTGSVFNWLTNRA